MVCGGGGGAAPAASREGAHAHLGGTLGGAIPSLHSNKTDSKRAWAHVYRRKRYHLKHVFFSCFACSVQVAMRSRRATSRRSARRAAADASFTGMSPLFRHNRLWRVRFRLAGLPRVIRPGWSEGTWEQFSVALGAAGPHAQRAMLHI